MAAFFQSTFEAWTNYKVSGRNRMYVGYCPAIGLDGDRILDDFPKGHVIHIIRNPFSAYADTKKRPFPLPLRRYIITWNIYHHAALMHQGRYPDRFHILRFNAEGTCLLRIAFQLVSRRLSVTKRAYAIHRSQPMAWTNGVSTA